MYPDRKSIGSDALPNDEIIRIRSRVALDFPASEIHQIQPVEDEGGSRLEMIINFMGMIGVSGVMPIPYTELAVDRIRYRDTALWSFLDIFTHRCASMFFRAWAKYRFPIDYERGNDAFTAFLFDFSGLGSVGLRGRMAVPDESLLPYTGLISQRPHSANAIENIVEDYFGVRASIEAFHGQWLPLDRGDLTRLGRQKNSLGSNTVAGTRIWDQQSKFRLRLGPLKLEKFQAFIPVGSGYEPLKSILDLMVGLEIDYDVQLCLEKAQVPKTILTTRAKRRPMLGWTSFLKTIPSEHDDEQLVLDLKS